MSSMTDDQTKHFTEDELLTHPLANSIIFFIRTFCTMAHMLELFIDYGPSYVYLMSNFANNNHVSHGKEGNGHKDQQLTDLSDSKGNEQLAFYKRETHLKVNFGMMYRQHVRNRIPEPRDSAYLCISLTHEYTVVKEKNAAAWPTWENYVKAKQHYMTGYVDSTQRGPEYVIEVEVVGIEGDEATVKGVDDDDDAMMHLKVPVEYLIWHDWQRFRNESFISMIACQWYRHGNYAEDQVPFITSKLQRAKRRNLVTEEAVDVHRVRREIVDGTADVYFYSDWQKIVAREFYNLYNIKDKAIEVLMDGDQWGEALKRIHTIIADRKKEMSTAEDYSCSGDEEREAIEEDKALQAIPDREEHAFFKIYNWYYREVDDVNRGVSKVWYYVHDRSNCYLTCSAFYKWPDGSEKENEFYNCGPKNHGCHFRDFRWKTRKRITDNGGEYIDCTDFTKAFLLASHQGLDDPELRQLRLYLGTKGFSPNGNFALTPDPDGGKKRKATDNNHGEQKKRKAPSPTSNVQTQYPNASDYRLNPRLMLKYGREEEDEEEEKLKTGNQATLIGMMMVLSVADGFSQKSLDPSTETRRNDMCIAMDVSHATLDRADQFKELMLKAHDEVLDLLLKLETEHFFDRMKNYYMSYMHLPDDVLDKFMLTWFDQFDKIKAYELKVSCRGHELKKKNSCNCENKTLENRIQFFNRNHPEWRNEVEQDWRIQKLLATV